MKKEGRTMAYIVDKFISTLPEKRQEHIKKHSKELVEEYMALQELRKVMELTQVEIAAKLSISQDGVSRLEKRSDVMLSTLRKYIEAMGGQLNLVAQFPNRPPVEIAGFSETADK